MAVTNSFYSELKMSWSCVVNFYDNSGNITKVLLCSDELITY